MNLNKLHKEIESRNKEISKLEKIYVDLQCNLILLREKSKEFASSGDGVLNKEIKSFNSNISCLEEETKSLLIRLKALNLAKGQIQNDINIINCANEAADKAKLAEKIGV